MNKLENLSPNILLEGSIGIELVEGIPILKASTAIQNRISELLTKQQDNFLDAEEEQELDGYEEIDDYLSFVNRTVRNLALADVQQLA
jgi:hypothetical protein